MFSVVVPCFNEVNAVEQTIQTLARDLPEDQPYELIFVNDGSTDGTAEKLDAAAEKHACLRVLHHKQNAGYGAALKTGIRKSRTELIVITDADGTYPNDRIGEMVKLAENADMVVGARIADNVEYPLIRKIPKYFLIRYASWIAGVRIPDMNSGLRVMHKPVLLKFLNILPSGFSFTTTITLAMLTNYYDVRYVPISYKARIGQSKIKPIRDTLNFVQLILRTGMYFAPLRVFFPIGVLLGFACILSGIYDVFVLKNLTDKTLIFLLFAMNTAMFALLADMIDKRSG